MQNEISTLERKNIKIPLLIKIYGFFIFLITLINFLFLDFVYAFHGMGKYFFIFLGVAFLWLGYSFSVYKYIKKPSIGIGRLHIFVLILMFLGNIASLIGGFINFGVLALILVIPLIIKLFLISRFSKINKILKSPENFSDEKYYLEKSQEKGLIKTFGIFFIGLIIFYFTYYTTPPIEFKRIPDSYFDDSELYKNVDSEENGFNILEKYRYGRSLKNVDGDPYRKGFIGEEYKKVLDKIKEIEKSEIYKKFNKEKFNEKINKFYNEENPKKFVFDNFNKNQLELIDLKRKEREKILSDAEYYIQPIREYKNSLRGIIEITKETIYNIEYYLKNNEIKKALNYLIIDYKYSNKRINGYGNAIFKYSSVRSFILNNHQINYVLDNYNLSKNDLKFLKENIEMYNFSKNLYKNMILYMYNEKKYWLKNNNIGKSYIYNHLNGENKIKKIRRSFLNKDINFLKFKTVFFDGNYLNEILKNIYFYSSEKDLKDENAICRGMKKRKFKNGNIDKLKILFFKRNGYSLLRELSYCGELKNKNIFQEIQKQEKELLEKIDRKIKEAEEREKNKKENGEKEEKINKRVLEFFKKK